MLYPTTYGDQHYKFSSILIISLTVEGHEGQNFFFKYGNCKYIQQMAAQGTFSSLREVNRTIFLRTDRPMDRPTHVVHKKQYPLAGCNRMQLNVTFSTCYI